MKTENLRKEMIEKSKRHGEPLKPISIRFPESRFEVITEVARRNSVSKSEVCRLAVDDRLLKYLKNQHFTSKEQEDLLIKAVNRLMNETVKVRVQLSRIGCNFNQELRLKHLKAKYESAYYEDPIIARSYEKEIQELEKNNFDVKQIDNIIARYEESLQKMGELLCMFI